MTYRNRIVRWSMAALLPVLAVGCLMEEPELTAEGELGVDPTSVTVEAEISLDLNLPDSETGEEKMYVNADNYPDAVHRITLAAYEGTSCVGRTIAYENLPLTNRFQTRVSLPLHARNYRLAGWIITETLTRMKLRKQIPATIRSISQVSCVRPEKDISETTVLRMLFMLVRNWI